MKSKKNVVLVTGGNGRFGKVYRKYTKNLNIHFPTKKELNILKINSIEKKIKKLKPKYIIHLAGLSRPMKIHDKSIDKSIDLNIIGTCNITKLCFKYNIKLIYFSTHYVYPGTKGDYKENDPVLPYFNYAWSKLGGECAVSMYKNSLILRICMTEYPFVHKEAFDDVKNNFMFHEDLAKILDKLIDLNGIYNIGGKRDTVFNFAKKNKFKVKPISAKNKFGKSFPLRHDMNIDKIRKYLKKNYEKN